MDEKRSEKVLQRLEQEPDEFLLYFDASYNKETDETGIGVVLYYKQGAQQYRERWNERVEGLKSNNEAEYCALHYAVKRLDEFPIAGKK